MYSHGTRGRVFAHSFAHGVTVYACIGREEQWPRPYRSCAAAPSTRISSAPVSVRLTVTQGPRGLWFRVHG
jgi:hypothetical protein